MASESLYKAKGSKFLSFAFPVRSENEVRMRLQELRKIYHDANHHCYAYIIGIDSPQYRSNDDGEPNHSAGDPILGQIRSLKLTNVLVVVVRYFGGTKLGVGGLISAYKTAAATALECANIIADVVKREVRIVFGYLLMNQVMTLVKEYGFEIKTQNFDLECELLLSVRESLLKEAENKFRQLEGLQLLID